MSSESSHRLGREFSPRYLATVGRHVEIHPLSWLKHLILPILGVLAIGFPLYALVQPGQMPPFNLFPWIALGIIVIGLIYAIIISRRDPTLGDRVGSIVADRE